MLESVLQSIRTEGGEGTMNANTAAYLRLEAMVRPPVPIRVLPRTLEEEDHIALECMILENEGPDALDHFHQETGR
jgi:hypothetical protein